MSDTTFQYAMLGLAAVVFLVVLSAAALAPPSRAVRAECIQHTVVLIGKDGHAVQMLGADGKPITCTGDRP